MARTTLPGDDDDHPRSRDEVDWDRITDPDNIEVVDDDDPDDEVAQRREAMIDMIEQNPYISTWELRRALGVTRETLHSDAHWIRKRPFVLCHLKNPDTGLWGWLVPEDQRDSKRYMVRRETAINGALNMVKGYVDRCREDADGPIIRTIDRGIKRLMEDLAELIENTEMEDAG